MTEKKADTVLKNTFAELDQILAERRSDNSGSDTSKMERKTGAQRKETAHGRKRVKKVPRLK